MYARNQVCSEVNPTPCLNPTNQMSFIASLTLPKANLSPELEARFGEHTTGSIGRGHRETHQFFGHCAGAWDEVVSSFLLWKHSSPLKRSQKLTFPDITRRDTAMAKENLLTAVTDGVCWKGVVNSISAEVARWGRCREREMSVLKNPGISANENVVLNHYANFPSRHT